MLKMLSYIVFQKYIHMIGQACQLNNVNLEIDYHI